MTTMFTEFNVKNYFKTESITPTKLQYKKLPRNRSKVNFEEKSFLYVTSNTDVGQRKNFPKKSGLPLSSRQNHFVFFFKSKVLLGIYQEDFFLILETFFFLGRRDPSSSGDFCWTSFKPCSLQQNLLNFNTENAKTHQRFCCEMRIADLTGGVDKQKQHFYFFLMTSHSCSHVYSIFTFITWEADFDKSYHSQLILGIVVLHI